MSATFEELEAAVEAAVEPTGQIDALIALAMAYVDQYPARTLMYGGRICAESEACQYQYGLAAGLRTMGAGYFRLSDFQKSREYINRAFDLFAELCDARGQGECRTIIGLLNWSTGDYPAAIDQHNKALEIFQSIGDKKNEATACNNIGISFHHLGNLDTALEYHLRSLAIREEIDDRRKIASSLGNIGSVYYQRGDTVKALEYFFRTLDISRDLNTSWSSADVYSNIGSTYHIMGEYEKALQYNTRCLELSQKINNREGEAHALNGLGDNHAALRQYTTAHTYYVQSLEISTALGMKEMQANTLLALADLAHACSAAAQAFEYSRRALEIGEDIHSRKIIFEAHLILAHSCKMAGDYELAFYHLEQFQLAKEAMYNEESDRKFNNLRLQYEVQHTKNESEIYRLKNVELAAVNEQLRVLNEEKNEFLGIAAHDLKNPLSTILMISNLMQSEAERLAAKDVQELAGDIRVSSNRMFELITNLLDIHAIEHQGARIQAEVINMADAVRSTMSSFHARAGQKEIAVRDDIGTEPMEIMADHGAIAQVLENLFSNALKFSPSGTTVTVVARRNRSNAHSGTGEDIVRVEVCDQGPGLSEADRQRLFQKFARLSAQPTGGEHSTGLGLSIVKKLVEAMNGAIWCESEPGRGATFIIEFPAVCSEADGSSR